MREKAGQKRVKRDILQRRSLNTLFDSQQEPDISYFTSFVERYYLKSLLNIPVAKLDASPPVDRALLANVDAWLNRSQREKATVLVIVKARAIAKVSKVSKTSPNACTKKGMTVPGHLLTNQAQPDHTLKSNKREYCKSYPQSRGCIQAQPEESLVRRVDGAGIGVRALEDPV